VSADPVRASSSQASEPASGEASAGAVGLSVRRPSPYLFVEDIKRRYGVSERWVHERTRLGEIPHFRHPGSRRCLFREDWLDAWDAGCELEVVERPHGGRIVRPRT
jgi:hypothetical protein